MNEDAKPIMWIDLTSMEFILVSVMSSLSELAFASATTCVTETRFITLMSLWPNSLGPLTDDC